MPPVEPTAGRRIWVIGVAGAGKTRLARDLSSAGTLPYHELDASFWGPGWRRAGEADFVREVAAIAAGGSWVVDGQYTAAHRALAAAADTVIWVDPPRRTALARLLRRTAYDLFHRTRLYHGNRQTVWKAVGLLLWALRSHSRVRRRNAALLRRLSATDTRCLTVRDAADRARVVALLHHGFPPSPDRRGRSGP